MIKNIAGVITAILLITAAPTNAQDLSKTEAQLEQMQAEAKAEAARKAEAEKNLKSVQSELVTTARKMQGIEQALSDLEQQRKNLKQEQADLTERMIRDKGLSTSLMRAVYRSAQLPPYGLYFAQQPKADTLHRMIALNTTLPALHQRMQNMETEFTELSVLQQEIAGVLTRRQQEQENLQSESKNLNNLLKSREKLYNTASASHRQRLKDVDRLQKEAKDIADLLAKLRPAPRPETLTRTASVTTTPLPKPSLPAGADKVLPVAGKIKTAFGVRDDIEAISTGITFSTPPEAVIVSPMAGTVMFAGPFQKYKRLLIIEHNDGYHSLIGGLDSIETAVDANLQAGEPVGRITRQTNTNGRLYYELRKNGKPVNPNTVFTVNKG